MLRRDLLKSIAAMGVIPYLATSQSADSIYTEKEYEKAIVIDGQGGPSDIPAINRESGVTAVSITVSSVGNASSAFEDSIKHLAQINGLLDENPGSFTVIRNLADLKAAKATGKMGLIYNFQDTAPIGSSLERISMFHDLGVRVIQLTYNKRNLCGDGALEKSNAGLSDLGRQTIAEINRHQIVLDLSHGGQLTIAEAIAESSKPPVISHSGCRALVDNPRNVHDQEMRALANKGGVFGLYLMPFLCKKGQPTAEDLMRHIEHAYQVCGEDHIGIGTDGGIGKAVIDDAYREDQRKFFEDRKAKGIAAPGEAGDIFNLIFEYNSPRKFFSIAQDLKKRGWPSARIDKLLGGNFARHFGEIWG